MNEEVMLGEPRVYYTTHTVAKLLKVTPRSVQRMRNKGLLETEAVIGNSRVYTAASVSDLLDYFQRRQWYRSGGESDGVE